MKNMINDIFSIIKTIFEGDEELTDLMIFGYLLPMFYTVIRMFIPITLETFRFMTVIFDIATYGVLFSIIITILRLRKAAFEYIEILTELEKGES